MKIILIGFMGSGKSSVGKLLAKILSMSFIETDREVVKRSGRENISEIFKNGGELRFREIEIEVAKELKDFDDVVIATGGGIVINKIILDYLENRGRNRVVFLDTKFTTIKNRLKNTNNRPLFSNLNEAKRLFEIRQPLYETYADVVVKTDNKSVENITQEVFERLGNL